MNRVLGDSVTVEQSSCQLKDQTGTGIALQCGPDVSVCQGGQWVQIRNGRTDTWRCERVSINETKDISLMADIAEHFTINDMSSGQMEQYDVDIFDEEEGFYSLRIGNSFRRCNGNKTIKECKNDFSTVFGVETQAEVDAMFIPDTTVVSEVQGR